MRKYSKSGWYGEHHRHYLAAKGISTKKYYASNDTVLGGFLRETQKAENARLNRLETLPVERSAYVAAVAAPAITSAPLSYEDKHSADLSVEKKLSDLERAKAERKQSEITFRKQLSEIRMKEREEAAKLRVDERAKREADPYVTVSLAQSKILNANLSQGEQSIDNKLALLELDLVNSYRRMKNSGSEVDLRPQLSALGKQVKRKVIQQFAKDKLRNLNESTVPKSEYDWLVKVSQTIGADADALLVGYNQPDKFVLVEKIQRAQQEQADKLKGALGASNV